jgi:hypothetical protein
MPRRNSRRFGEEVSVSWYLAAAEQRLIRQAAQDQVKSEKMDALASWWCDRAPPGMKEERCCR